MQDSQDVKLKKSQTEHKQLWPLTTPHHFHHYTKVLLGSMNDMKLLHQRCHTLFCNHLPNLYMQASTTHFQMSMITHNLLWIKTLLNVL